MQPKAESPQKLRIFDRCPRKPSIVLLIAGLSLLVTAPRVPADQVAGQEKKRETIFKRLHGKWMTDPGLQKALQLGFPVWKEEARNMVFVVDKKAGDSWPEVSRADRAKIEAALKKQGHDIITTGRFGDGLEDAFYCFYTHKDGETYAAAVWTDPGDRGGVAPYFMRLNHVRGPAPDKSLLFIEAMEGGEVRELIVLRRGKKANPEPQPELERKPDLSK